MRANAKANYSPVRQQLNQRVETTAAGRPPKHITSIELRQTDTRQEPTLFIDDDGDDDNEGFNGSLGHSNNASVARQQPVEDQASLEEVYLCNCCGISKQLVPSIKYMSTFRNLFFIFNFLVFAFGLANLGMGLWFRIDPKVYEIHKYIETQNFTIAGWLMLGCGFSACLMALLGFSAAAQQLVGQLVCYFSTMILLTLAFMGTLVLLTVYGLGVPLERFLTKEIYEQIRRRSMNSEMDLFMSSDAVQFLDFVQVKMRCCGASDFRDYGKLGMMIPTTCYTINENVINAPGCGRAIRELFDIRAGMAAGFSSASVVVQLITTIMSALMFCSIYHLRANPRQPATSASPQHQVTTNMTTAPPSTSPVHPTSVYFQRPRSRTPIII